MDIKQTKLSTISNIIFLSSCIFTLSFIWLNYYYRHFKSSLTLAIIITVLFAVIIICYKVLKHKKQIKQRKQYSLENLKTSILLTPNEIIINDLFILFNISANKINDRHYINQNNDYYFFLDKDSLDNSDYYYINKTKQSNNIHLFCISAGLPLTSENINIEINDINSIYNTYITANHPIYHYSKVQKRKKIQAKELLSIIISKQKSKSYFFYGLFIIFASIFTPYSIYYIISGTILLILSILCRLVKFKNK